jgi:hypothetical protein
MQQQFISQKLSLKRKNPELSAAVMQEASTISGNHPRLSNLLVIGLRTLRPLETLVASAISALPRFLVKMGERFGRIQSVLVHSQSRTE